MFLERGDIKNPTGNAVIYWMIRGKNKLLKNAELIASNFVVSPLQVNDETLMVNFPPVIIDSYEKLLRIAELNNVDVIQGGEIYVPDDITDFPSFYKKQLDKYNGIIQEYLRAFKGKSAGVSDAKSLPELINLAAAVMDSVRLLVKKKENPERIRLKIGKLKEIQKFLDREMGGFDLYRVIRYIDKPGSAVDDLVELYKHKFFAVFLEDYEKAANLKKEIRRLERCLKM